MADLPSEIGRICDHIVQTLTRRTRTMIRAELKRLFGPSFLGGKLKWSAVLAPTTTTQTADYTLPDTDTNTDDWVIVDATSAAFTLTFPPVANREKPYFILKKDNANSVTFAPDPVLGTDTFNGAASFVLSAQYAWAIVKPDTDNGAWYVEVGGGSPAMRTITTTATLDAVTDDWVILDATSAAFTLTFPAVSARSLPYYLIKKDAVHAVTYGADGSDTFSGPGAIVQQFTWAVVKPDTANGVWYVSTPFPPAAAGATLYYDGTSWVQLPIT